MTVSILNYTTATLEVINIPENHINNIERYLFEVLDYNENDISWMVTHYISMDNINA